MNSYCLKIASTLLQTFLSNAKHFQSSSKDHYFRNMHSITCLPWICISNKHDSHAQMQATNWKTTSFSAFWSSHIKSGYLRRKEAQQGSRRQNFKTWTRYKGKEQLKFASTLAISMFTCIPYLIETSYLFTKCQEWLT